MLEAEKSQEALVQKINCTMKNLEDVVDENRELRKRVICTLFLHCVASLAKPGWLLLHRLG